jgi:hypothetical protein
VKVLITGRKDKLWRAIGAAFARQSGISISLVPAGSAAIGALRSPLDAVVYTLSGIEDIELLRWVLKINPSVPLIAVIPSSQSRLRKQLEDEGASQVVEVSALGSTQIRSSLGPLLRKFGMGPGREARQEISDDLHAIRSALTAIQGNAEMVLKRTNKAAPSRKQLEEIPRGVSEIERLLRRVHRTIRSRPLTTPPRPSERRSGK